MDTTAVASAEPYVAVHQSAKFIAMHDRWRAFIRRWSLALIAWWLPVIVLAGFAPGFYRIKVVGDVNIGFVIFLASFGLTLLTTGAYLRFTRTTVEPVSEQVRAELEGVR